MLVQRRSGDRELLDSLFENFFKSNSFSTILNLSLTENEGLVLREYLMKTDFANSMNLHLVYLLQRCKFTEAAELTETLIRNNKINSEPPKNTLSGVFSTMERLTRKLSTTVDYRETNGKQH